MNGKKTYLVSLASIVGAVCGAITGTVSIADAAQIAVTAILAATVRHGVTNG